MSVETRMQCFQNLMHPASRMFAFEVVAQGPAPGWCALLPGRHSCRRLLGRKTLGKRDTRLGNLAITLSISRGKAKSANVFLQAIGTQASALVFMLYVFQVRLALPPPLSSAIPHPGMPLTGLELRRADSYELVQV